MLNLNGNNSVTALNPAVLPQRVAANAADRLRPILMTSLTTIVALLPMVVAADKTGLWYALALARMGGMISSTLLVLLVVPALCAIGKS